MQRNKCPWCKGNLVAEGCNKLPYDINDGGIGDMVVRYDCPKCLGAIVAYVYQSRRKKTIMEYIHAVMEKKSI